MPPKGRHKRRAVFIDKDGTLIVDVPHNVDPSLVVLSPHAEAATRLLADAGYLLVVVTNQPGIAVGMFGRAALQRLQEDITRRLALQGVPLHGFYCCPHAPRKPGQPGCICRKPEPGLLLEAAFDHGIDLARSWMIGDILDDVEAGRRAGCRSLLLDVGHETVWHTTPFREPDLRAPDLLTAAQAILQNEAARAARAARHGRRAGALE